MSAREKGEGKRSDANVEEWPPTRGTRDARAVPDTAELSRLANLLVVELMRKV